MELNIEYLIVQNDEFLNIEFIMCLVFCILCLVKHFEGNHWFLDH